MTIKIKNNSGNVLLEKVSDSEFWLRFQFVDDGMLVDEPVEIHDDSDGDEEFQNSIEICKIFWEMKHFKWKINITNLDEWLKNPRAVLIDQCRIIKKKYPKK